jgi:hypothetical protein
MMASLTVGCEIVISGQEQFVLFDFGIILYIFSLSAGLDISLGYVCVQLKKDDALG